MGLKLARKKISYWALYLGNKISDNVLLYYATQQWYKFWPLKYKIGGNRTYGVYLIAMQWSKLFKERFIFNWVEVSWRTVCSWKLYITLYQIFTNIFLGHIITKHIKIQGINSMLPLNALLPLGGAQYQIETPSGYMASTPSAISTALACPLVVISEVIYPKKKSPKFSNTSQGLPFHKIHQYFSKVFFLSIESLFSTKFRDCSEFPSGGVMHFEQDLGGGVVIFHMQFFYRNLNY